MKFLNYKAVRLRMQATTMHEPFKTLPHYTIMIGDNLNGILILPTARYNYHLNATETRKEMYLMSPMLNNQ